MHPFGDATNLSIADANGVTQPDGTTGQIRSNTTAEKFVAAGGFMPIANHATHVINDVFLKMLGRIQTRRGSHVTIAVRAGCGRANFYQPVVLGGPRTNPARMTDGDTASFLRLRDRRIVG